MTTEIQTRIKQIQDGEVPNGYKKLKVTKYIVPEKWDETKLADIVTILTQKAGNDKYETLSISAGIGFVNQASKFGKEISGNQYEKYIVISKNDFSYNKGNSKKYPQGCIYQLVNRNNAVVPSVFESFRIQKGFHNYFSQLFLSGFLNHQLSKKINHGVRDDGLLNLTSGDFYNSFIIFPPLAEQQKIAEIISTQDKVIELKQNLIAEKQKQKKYLMQKLLSNDGATFTIGGVVIDKSKWKKEKLGNLCENFTGLTYSPEDVSEKGTIVLRSSNIQDSRLVFDNTVYVQMEIPERAKVKNNDILVCVRNGSHTLIGKSTFIENSNNMSFGAFMTILRSKGIKQKYLFYLWQSEIIQKQIKVSMGATINQITNADIQRFYVYLSPTLPEQEIIAEILSTADKELSLLQNELEQEKQKKKSLTQLLLTGIARVKI